MRRTSALVAAFAVALLALAPGLADARAGGGASMGSRGSMTFSAPPSTSTAPYSAAPMQRSMTPFQPSTPAPGFAQPGYAGGRSPFMSGLLGGLVGAGIGGLLFGHGLFGGISGGFGFIGFLLQIFLLFLLGRWLLRLFTGGQPVFANGGPGGMFSRQAGGGMPGPMAGGGGRGPARQTVAITPADYQAFEALLKGVQAAWSDRNMAALQRIATPEMVSYFADQLAGQASQGLVNTVTDVRLLQGDLAEAWAEGGRQYATVAMKFTMIDITRDGSGRIVDGSASEHVTVTEIWTFLRAAGGNWVLSAIQQAR
jgi:predicted lipid-binding transport protein (Tim44 family)